MAQNPDVMGYEGVKAAVKAINGESLGGAVTDTGSICSDQTAVKQNLFSSINIKIQQEYPEIWDIPVELHLNEC